MSNTEYKPPEGPPPGVTQPPPAHQDGGDRGFGPNNQYPPQEQYGYYQQQPQGWNQGPPGPWQQQGPPPGPYYGPPPQGMYYQQGPPVGYVDRGPGAAGEGCCAALLTALTCCCCLELLF